MTTKYIPLVRPKLKYLQADSISSVKCDNPSCDHIEHGIDFEATQESYFGKPCPKCGQDLYTQAHYDEMKIIFEKAASVDAIADKISNRIEAAKSGGEPYSEMQALDDLFEFLAELEDLASHDQVRFKELVKG